MADSARFTAKQRADMARQREKLSGPKRKSEVEVWEENVPVFRVFLCVQTQWRVDGMSGACHGFDYPGLEAAMRMSGIECTPEIFDDLRVMELAGASEKNESARRARDADK